MSSKFFYSIFCLIFCLIIVQAGFSNSQEDFDVIYYEINISINPQTETVAGYVTVRALSEINGLNSLLLNFYDNMNVTSVAENAASFTHENDLLTINLNQSYNQNDTITVTIHYNGHPDVTEIDFDPLTFDRSRSTVTISSESCPYYARCWWPCKDRPDDKPEMVDLKITVPEKFIVAATGALKQITPNGDGTKTHHWQMLNPIATYLVAFTISDYHIIEDFFVNASNDTLKIMEFVYPEHLGAAMIDFDNVSDMIEILSLYYGKYPYFNEKYGIAEYVGYWGGMEYQTLTCLQPFMIRGDHEYESTFLHELAHQWWGDCVSPKTFHHSWLSEGFAVFSEALYYGHLEGQDRYHEYMNNNNNALNLKGTLYRSDISHPNTVYASIVYNKGAWVIHMLRHVVGEDNFWAGLQKYFNRHKYSSATTEDLQQAFEDVTADTLGWFFNQWVYGPNYPQYAFGWCLEPITNNNIIKIFIDQVQTDAPLFQMPVDITLYSASSESTFTVIVNDSNEIFSVQPSQNIIDVKIDKDDWILKKTVEFTSPLLEYYSHQVVDSTENNNGLAEAGETVWLKVTIANMGLPAYSIFAKLLTDDPDIYIQAETAQIEFIGINFDHLATDSLLLFSFLVSPSAAGHLSTFKLELTGSDMTSSFTLLDSFCVKIGNPKVLLVDDDNGAAYEQFFYQPMLLAKIYIDSWDCSNLGTPSFADVLKNYQTLIWFTGDDRTTSLTSAEQVELTSFLDQGGKLILTGQNIGFDLVADGTTEDSLFFANYLHAEFLADTVKPTMIMGTAGDPIGSGLFININPVVGGAENQTAPSAITPLNGAISFFKYIPQMTSAGIRYCDENYNYRLVFLPFGFEGISGPYSDSAQRLISRIMSWLSGETVVKDNNEKNLFPKAYQLEQNYPNPFNPTTRIKFSLPEANFVNLSIYNLLGQKIKVLVNESLQPGFYEKIWDGTDDFDVKMASGIYVYLLSANSYRNSKKLILLK